MTVCIIDVRRATHNCSYIPGIGRRFGSSAMCLQHFAVRRCSTEWFLQDSLRCMKLTDVSCGVIDPTAAQEPPLPHAAITTCALLRPAESRCVPSLHIITMRVGWSRPKTILDTASSVSFKICHYCESTQRIATCSCSHLSPPEASLYNLALVVKSFCALRNSVKGSSPLLIISVIDCQRFLRTETTTGSLTCRSGPMSICANSLPVLYWLMAVCQDANVLKSSLGL
jgi:hypothetical protein